MNPIITIALLTLREAVRRRLVAACAAITVGLVGLSAWGFDRLSHTHSITSGEVSARDPSGAHLVHVHVQLRRGAERLGDGVAGDLGGGRVRRAA